MRIKNSEIIRSPVVMFIKWKENKRSGNINIPKRSLRCLYLILLTAISRHSGLIRLIRITTKEMKNRAMNIINGRN